MVMETVHLLFGSWKIKMFESFKIEARSEIRKQLENKSSHDTFKHKDWKTYFGKMTYYIYAGVLHVNHILHWRLISNSYWIICYRHFFSDKACCSFFVEEISYSAQIQNELLFEICDISLINCNEIVVDFDLDDPQHLQPKW